MKRTILLMAVVATGLFGAKPAPAAEAPESPAATQTADDLAKSGIAWQDWSQAAFDLAARDKKLVLLHLGAGWCHWCHVMEHTTYRDPAVVELIKAHYIAIHVDQDARPDLSHRYEDYGWPATILFDAAGKELVKWQGYLPPDRMAALLKATADDPTPGPSAQAPPEVASGDSELTDDRAAMLAQRLDERYDETQSAWGRGQKFVQWDILEFEMGRSLGGNMLATKRVRDTLNNARKLIDPVWGGIYQYSTDNDWDHPHFEKIMQFQAESMRTYAMAYGIWRDPADLESAKSIAKIVLTFLKSREGAFYTSQDADIVPGEHGAAYFALDDAGRRKIGVPRVDTHIYSQENGWAARGLIAVYAASGDWSYLERAREAMNWIAANRSLPGGGFRHDQKDPAGPYLGDTLAMGRAYLALYQATGERAALDAARSAFNFIDKNFKGKEAGYLTATATGAVAASPQFDENLALARTANLLYHYTGDDRYRRMAMHSLHFLSSPTTTEAHWPAGVLLAASELSHDPIHVTIVGPLDDPAAKALHEAAMAAGVSYLRLDWWDPSQGAPIRDDIQYPKLTKPAAFLCSTGTCSPPINDPAKLTKQLRQRGRLPA